MPLHQFGTLAPGHYPRIETTFGFPSMMVNFLSVSAIVLLMLKRQDKLPTSIAWLLLGATFVTALFGLTPGLGGFAFVLSAWVFVTARAPALRWAALISGILLGLAQVPIASVTPIIHSTTPYVIWIFGLDQPLAPSVRLMCWTAATQALFANPLLGAGYGSVFLAVPYMDPSGALHLQRDAHNVFLNIGAQAGLVGLAGLAALIVAVAKRTGQWRLADGNRYVLPLGIAWLAAFCVQGLTGSYEDARHLWLLLGLWLAAHRLQGEAIRP
jgi:hypothetical protein